ncbi:RAMP superfamily CRISPR-associated protein [Actinomyces ruminicola]|uniref:CRISPR/Cas system CSM-associated protein Csm3, group 7 of RAMP superfamily n=1 Tax=Actinomyces ruminicola TaxID=332524 RepID=A0A1G9RLQ8_9ACTO|nr:RAMP superfamily CRISPR-associated protein [Actinomyces ruminicola]SDM24183.1 CRISPR/Cas system CSM-associated protein Csm3, group 7 of RAMP superfamily [Actinomyces ruminicola]
MSITRYKLTIQLQTASPLHSGGIDEFVDPTRSKEERKSVPRRFVRDGHERPIITGRSVKGAVWAACRRYVKNHSDAGLTLDDLDFLQGLAEDNRAGALTFHSIDLSKVAERERQPKKDQSTKDPLITRTGIAVDRYWGTAGDTALFQHEYVPTGKQLALAITAQVGTLGGEGDPSASTGNAPSESTHKEKDPEVAVERLFALIVALFAQERIAFGGRRSAGWGRVRLKETKSSASGQPATDEPWTLVKTSLASKNDLLAWLAPSDKQHSQLEPANIAASGLVRITITWDSPTGILVAETPSEDDDSEKQKQKQSETQKESDETVPAKPLRSGPGEKDPLVLPGSSVRGALRSRASRIARTVLAAKRPEKMKSWQDRDVHEQLADDPILVLDLFGSTKHRGALTVLDTVASSDGTGRKVTHNAGDRWTGGVAEGALYSEMVYDNAKWNDIVLELDADALPGSDDRRKAAWCLLGLVIAELCTGTLPLGSRGTRGMGQVSVSAVRVETGNSIIPGWNLAAKANDSESLARGILAELRKIDIAASPDADEGWEGWSSYLAKKTDKEISHA